ncbi:beta-propeller fold lactonase family protein [Quadrisphaera sp. INWT6]|uniref:lactonase family protein n=1 Tax=Quadrisphaera sp. INWT6 TaxID=2596917 RepID=UPI0018926339|nr:beta-propeller fold lactonase family protein [Quadrisphaera sp. INWT6]MBF5080269.1 lactonase family protein [Quadrisphaera sp. INWT6]
MSDLLAVGSYTPATGGRGAGIGLVARDPATGRLGADAVVLPAASPSHLAPAGPVSPVSPAGGAGGAGGAAAAEVLVHAAHELPEGLLSTWRLRRGDASRRSAPGGEQLAEVPSGGAHPCHVAVHPSGRLLVVSDYGGTTGVVAAEGGVARRLVQVLEPRGSGPRSDRQEGPHPHSASFLDDGHVVVADLGTDELRVHAVVLGAGGAPARLDPDPVQVVAAPPGSGPRTALVRRRGGGARLHVTGELDATLLAADAVGGRLGELHAVPPRRPPPPPAGAGRGRRPSPRRWRPSTTRCSWRCAASTCSGCTATAGSSTSR